MGSTTLRLIPLVICLVACGENSNESLFAASARPAAGGGAAGSSQATAGQAGASAAGAGGEAAAGTAQAGGGAGGEVSAAGNGGAAGEIAGGAAGAGVAGSDAGAGAAGEAQGGAGQAGGGEGGAGGVGEAGAAGSGGAVDPCHPGKVAGPIVRVCAPSTDDECDGASDTNPSLPNQTTGNGFDDDCDGLVDEGCACDSAHPPGTTRRCFAVPASQVDPATLEPVGFCNQQARGNMACAPSNDGVGIWDGYCMGAQGAYPDDLCGPGDFDCDGLDGNSGAEGCGCDEVEVTCPTEPIVISPYPDALDLSQKKPNPYDPHPEQPFGLDGHAFIKGDFAKTSGWWWVVWGGDCDNVLPHVTFALFDGPNTTTANRVGVEAPGLGVDHRQRGLATDPAGDTPTIWPAFTMSGDYVAVAAFKANGVDHYCSVQVKVRAPGLRTELCWDMHDAGFGNNDNDVDLHLARLQDGTGAPHGWFATAGTAPDSDDCYWACDSGCRTGNQGFCMGKPAPAPGWGYPPSSDGACHGWGSGREPTETCDNPRVDRDVFACSLSTLDPGQIGTTTAIPNSHCGAENVNLDNPVVGDAFLVGAHFYSGTTAHPRVIVYCDGERRLAFGRDPGLLGAGSSPQLTTSFNPTGGDSVFRGDLFTAARVTWLGGADGCLVEPIPSTTPKPSTDVTQSACVDTGPQNGASDPTAPWLFTPGGGYPHDGPAAAACWH